MDKLEDAGKDEEEIEDAADHEGEHLAYTRAVGGMIVIVDLDGSESDGSEYNKEEIDNFKL